MPFLGAHMSIAGGIHYLLRPPESDPWRSAPDLHNQSEAMASGPILTESIELFKMKWEESGRVPVAAHDAYLINLAAVDGKFFPSPWPPLLKSSGVALHWVFPIS